MASSPRLHLLLLVAIANPAAAQKPEPPPVAQVLDRLEANYTEYAHSVPNLFCDERVKSSYGPVASFVKPLEAVTESTFRLQRVAGPNHTAMLKESRDIRAVDGKPTARQEVAGPSILSGVFGTALGLVSTAETRCMKFKQHPHLTGSGPDGRRIVIDFSPLPRRARDPACGTRQSEGRAFIDPETMRLRRIEVKTSDYEILPSIVGEWDWSADYDPVLFDGKPFWLPHTIESTAIPYGHSNMAWSFTARYSACHQLAVKARILPGLAEDPTLAPADRPTPPSLEQRSDWFRGFCFFFVIPQGNLLLPCFACRYNITESALKGILTENEPLYRNEQAAPPKVRELAGITLCSVRPRSSRVRCLYRQPSRETEARTMEFHIARAARERYQVDETLFNYVGNVVFGDVLASRKLAQKMNEVRAAQATAGTPNEPVNAGALFAMGLIDELSHAVVARYRDSIDPDVLPAALAWFSAHLTPPQVETLLRTFTAQFPNVAVFRGEQTLDQWLADSTDGLANREAALEELMMLWLANANPACKPFHELFDDRDLAVATIYKTVTAQLGDFFATRPAAGPGGESLFDILRAPMLASPDSLSGQLDFIREEWLPFIGDEIRQVLFAQDVLREEEIAIWTRFHPPPPGTDQNGWTQNGPRDWGMLGFEGDEYRGFDEYRGADETRRRTLREAAAKGVQEAPVDEYEAFSQDHTWMPTVVLLAKSTYVWLEQLSKQYGRHIHKLDQIPEEELQTLAGRGMNGLWLIGLWERSVASQTIKRMRGQADAVASAYSLRDYRIAEDLGGEKAYEVLRDRARAAGIRLASDMVPNHMGIDSTWVIEHPDWFVSRPESPFPVYRFQGPDLSPDDRVEIRIEDHYFDQTDAAVVFELKQRSSGQTDYVYHGNDGTTFAWNDTAQLNYSRADVREHVIQTIIQVARLFPIIRFDAAMTLAKKHVQRLWFPLPGEPRSIPSRNEDAMLQEEFDALMPHEFWREVVDRVAVEVPGTLLLAEAFWLLEGYFVRTLGMHRVYNSAFMNMLRDEENAKYRSYLKKTIEFDPDILKRYVNFMSNPDERTAIDQFGSGDKYFGCATLMATLPGLPMFGHGQVEAYTERYGMEYKRAKFDETPNEGLVARHQREIMPLLKDRALFAESAFFRMYDFNTGGGVDENVFAFSNREGDRRAAILFNNSLQSTHGAIHWSVEQVDKGSGLLRGDTLGDAIRLPWDDEALLRFRDSASNLEFLRWSRDLRESGLTMPLRGYQYVVLLDWQELHATAEHPWDRLCNALDGAGAPSLDEELANLRLRPIHDALRQVLSPSTIEGVLAMLQSPEPNPASPISVPEPSPASQDPSTNLVDNPSHESAAVATVEAGTDRAADPGQVTPGPTVATAAPPTELPGAPSLAPFAKGGVTPSPANPSTVPVFETGEQESPPPGPFDWLIDRADTFYAALEALDPQRRDATDQESRRTRLDQLLHAVRALPTLPLGVETHGALPTGLVTPQSSTTWAPILAWCLLEPVAESFDAAQLRQTLASTFSTLSLSPEETWKAVARVRLLLDRPAPTTERNDFAAMPDTFWNDPEVQWLTGLTEAASKSYFNKESLEHFLAWLTLPTLVEHPEQAPDITRQLAASYTRARKAGYQLNHVLAGNSPTNGVSAAIEPEPERTVEEQTDPTFHA